MARPSATIDLKGDDTDLKRALAAGERRMKKFASNVGASLKSAFKVAAVALPLAALAFVTKSIKLAREQVQAEKKLEAVLRATGNAAGFTADELKKMAADLQKVTNFGDEVTISALAVLATFKEIKGDQFREAIESAQDMASVMETDLKGAVLQLGKALNDPIRGISALSRAGVSFTTEQKELIKVLQESGDIMGAQKIILAELKSEFGGAAKEMVDPVTQAFHDLGDIMEKVGLIALPTINEWAKDASKEIGLLSESLDGLGLLFNRIELSRLLAQETRTPKEERRVEQLRQGISTQPTAKDVRAGRGRFESLQEAFQEANEGRLGTGLELIAFEEGLVATRREAAHATELLDFEGKLEAARQVAAEVAAELAQAEEDATLGLIQGEGELEEARRKSAKAIDDLADAEVDAAKAREDAAKAQEKAAAKVQESIDEFRQRLTIGIEEGPKSADQARLDELLRAGQIGGIAHEEIQGLIDQNVRQQEQRELDIEGEALEERVATPFEQLEKTLAVFGKLFDARAIDQETLDRATLQATKGAQEAFQAGLPDFGPSGADVPVDVQGDGGFQARFEGITEISNRIAAAAASRGPGDRAIKAAEQTAAATKDGAKKLADLNQHTLDMNGTLIDIGKKLPAAAIAG